MRVKMPTQHLTESHDHGLGRVPRPYEIPSTRQYATVTHRTDESWFGTTDMLPDENGTLLVLAKCGKHYARQSQADLKAGKVAPCESARKWASCG